MRKAIHNNEWWFSVIDIIEALTGTERPRKYWNDLKKKLISEGYFEVSENIGQLKLPAPDGKMRETDCAERPAKIILGYWEKYCRKAGKIWANGWGYMSRIFLPDISSLFNQEISIRLGDFIYHFQ